MTETNRIEFKRELTKELDIEREVVAFLNYREGGVVYIGIDDAGNYKGTDRYDLISNNEYGYTCLLTAVQKVLDKLDVENQVSTTLTPTGRHDTPQWDRMAIREAVINAVVHNDYTYNAPAKIELFSDHIEITSVGRIPDGMDKDDFFSGMSMPRNKELMRVFRDMEKVEALGSGMMRIMRTYSRDNFEFGNNFIRFQAKYFDTVNGTVNSDDNKTQLTERQLTILKIIFEASNNTDTVNEHVNEHVNDRVNIEYIMSELHVSKSTVRRELAALIETGHIVRIGSDKTGHWEVVPQKHI